MQCKVPLMSPQLSTFEPLEVPRHHHPGPCKCEPTIAYVRVSKVGKRDVIISPRIQLGAIQDNAIAKNKRIVDVFTDIDKSGRTFLKRSVDEVVAAIGRGAATSVTVWKWSRWGRKVETSLVYVSKVVAAGGRVDSATEDMDQATAVGRFSRGVMMQVDEFLSDQIGEGWQAAHDLRREAGLPHSGRPHFGYVYVRRLPIGALRDPAVHDGAETCDPCLRGVAHFVAHPRESAKLVEMYQRYTAATSLRSLAADLNGGGYRTSMGGAWTPQALGQYLDTGFAAGYLRSRSAPLLAAIKAKTVPASNKLSSFDVWNRGAHTALIDEELWQRYRARRTSQASLPPRVRTAAHALSGLLVCGECARRLTTKYCGAAQTHQWTCSWADSQHSGVSVSLSNSLALGVMREWVSAMAEPISTGETQDVMVRRVQAETDAPAPRTRAQIEADIGRWLTRIDRLIDRLTDETISREVFLGKQAEYENNVNALRAELTELDTAPSPGSRPDYAVFETLDAAWDSMEPAELNDVLGAVVGMCLVSPAGPRGAARLPLAERAQVVGAWEMASWERFFSARRKRPFA